jgi:hypothetical protein
MKTPTQKYVAPVLTLAAPACNHCRAIAAFFCANRPKYKQGGQNSPETI